MFFTRSNIFNVPAGSAGSQLFVYIQTVQSYLAPPLTMTFALGILWPGLTEAGALSGLIVGFLLGILKFIMGNVYPTKHCGDVDDRPGFVKLHFMFYGEEVKPFMVPPLVAYMFPFEWTGRKKTIT